MNNDPADAIAEDRRKVGLHCLIAVDQGLMTHPSVGGTRGYPVWHRLLDLDRAEQGLEIDASRSSHWRWNHRILPFRMTGNRSNGTIVGADQLLAVICVTIWPDSTTDDIATFVFNEGGGVYTRGQVSKRMKEMEITRKVGSTEAYEAFTPDCVLRVELFWTRPPPLGVASIERRRFIDVDEFGVCLNKCNRKRGYSVSFYRVRKPGHYARTAKLTVLLGIEPGDPQVPPHIDGSVEKPRRWVRVLQNHGTTIEVFRDFIEEICTEIEVDGLHLLGYDTDDRRVFLWDNLNSHLSHLVTQVVEARGDGPTIFTSVPRPPYQPKYGPIEYTICDLVGHLAIDAQANWTTALLEVKIREASQQIKGIWNNFDFCGYPFNY